MTSLPAPQSLSAERREEVRQLWCENGGWFDEVDDAVMRGPDFWCFWAALDAQHAERTRAEVEKMRKAAILQIQAEASATEDGETLESLNRVIERLRGVSIEGTGQ